jgi:hypothetical protein
MSNDVIVLPPKFANRSDRKRAQVLLARKVLWELIAAAKIQAGAIRWINEGGLELEEMAEALDTGAPHPLLKAWDEKKRAIGHRSPATAREKHAQRVLCLAAAALERVVSLSREEAREVVAKAAVRVFQPPPTAKAIEHWQADQQLRSPADEVVLANAITAAGGDRDRLLSYFIGIACAATVPGTLLGTA